MFGNEYIKYFAAALISTCVGSQVVHKIYQPMKNYSEMVEQEKARIRKILADRKNEASQNSQHC